MEIVIAMYIRFIDLADLVFSTKFDEITFIELSSRGAQCLSSRCFRFQILPTSPDSTTDSFSSSYTDFTLSEISLPSIAEGPLSIFLFLIELSVWFSA